MTHDTLSALLDNECSAEDLDRLLDQMEQDPSIAARYSRMVLAREAQSSRIRAADPGFADRVLAALDQAGEVSGSRVLPFRLPGRVLRQYLAPAAGLAMAAGFGALAFLTLRPDAVSPVIETQVAVAATAPVDPADTAGRQWDQLDPSDAERLNAYLISYSQSRAQQGMGSTLGYARFAAHTAEYRPQRIQGPTAQPVALRETR